MTLDKALLSIDQQIQDEMECFKQFMGDLTLSQHNLKALEYLTLARDVLSPREPTLAGIRLAAETVRKAILHLEVVKQKVGD